MQTAMLVVGILALVAGALIAVMRLRTVYFGASAEGKVVGQTESSSSSTSGGSRRSTPIYAPIVEFTHAGKKHRFTSSLGQSEKIPEGSKVPVRFLPDAPDGSAEIATPGRMWGFPIAALAAGTIFVVLSQVVKPSG